MQLIITQLYAQGERPSSFFYALSIFLGLLFLGPQEAAAYCGVNLPSLSAMDGCVVADHAPSAYWGQVEFMWARNVNGNIEPVTGWSTNHPLTFCPSESGYYRMCARKVGCSSIRETMDVYVNTDGSGGMCFQVQNKRCGKRLDIEASSQNNGGKAILWGQTEGLNQRFTFEPLGNGWYKIIAAHSGKVLDAEGGWGPWVIQWDWHGGQNQQWKLVNAGNGYYRIKNRQTRRYLDLRYGGCNDGNRLRLKRWSRRGSQKWKLVPTDCEAEEVCTGTIQDIRLEDLSGNNIDIILEDGASYALSTLPSAYRIEAKVNGDHESLQFNFTGDLTLSTTENGLAYTYPGGTGNTVALEAGTYTINTKLFSEDNLGGQQCDEKTITITIVDDIPEPCTGTILDIRFEDLSGNNIDVLMEDGVTYGLSQLPTAYRIEAKVAGDHESLQFNFTGDLDISTVENGLAYTYPAGSGNTVVLAPGTYTINTKLFSDDNLGGLQCDEKTVTITIVDDGVDCEEVFEAGSIAINQWFTEVEICAGDPIPVIGNNVAPNANGAAIEIVWLVRYGEGTRDDCVQAINNELGPLNVGQLYDQFLALGGFAGGAHPMVGNSGWQFIEDGDADDLSLSLASMPASGCFMRCIRKVGCERFVAESIPTPVRIQINTCGGGALATETQSSDAATRGQVIGRNSSGVVDQSASIELANTATTIDFQVYPNPANTELFLNLAALGGVKGNIRIFNNLGQVIETMAFQALPQEKMRIDLGAYANGLYILAVEADQLPIRSKRFMVEKK